MTFRQFLAKHYGSIENAAKQIDLQRATLYNYMKDPSKMRLETFILICNQTQTTMSDLLMILTRKNPNQL